MEKSDIMRIFLSLFLAAATLVSCDCTSGNTGYHTLFHTDPADSTRDVSCYRIPALTEGPDGILIAAADERVPSCGDLKWNGNINIVIRRSSDRGLTWEESRRIIDFPEGQSASDPSFIYDPHTRTVFLFYNYMDLDKARDEYRFHVTRSTDGGITWSEPEDITDSVVPESWQKDFKFITSGHGTVTRDGTLLHTIVNLEKGLHIFGSSDHGKSWYLLETALTPADESKIIALNDGTWIVNSRVNGQGYRHVYISGDNGTNWESIPCKELPDPGCNGAVTGFRYRNKDYLLFVNAADPEHRRNLTLRYSTDKGATWSSGMTIEEGDAAYSDIAVLPDGTVTVIYEKGGYTSISSVSFPFSRLL